MSQLVIHRTDVPDVFAERMNMARVFADSDLLPGHLRGRPANVLIILEGARALDVSAFWALQSMYVVDGKLTMSAELMRGLVLRAGHKFRVIERTDKKAAVEIVRSDDDRPYIAEFTMAEANAAGLTGKGNWKKYPKAMLVARATSTAVRDHCPDVLFGVVYTPDEMGAETDQAGNAIIDENGVRQGLPELTQIETDEIAEQFTKGPLTELVNLWQMVQRRGGEYLAPSGQDDSLTDYLLARVAAELRDCKARSQVRDVWQLAKALGVLGANVPVKVRGTEDVEVRKLAEVLEAAAAGLPETAPETDAQWARNNPKDDSDPVAEPTETAPSRIDTPDILEPDEIIEAEPKPPIDTENAQQMRAEAAESWGDVREQLVEQERVQGS